jgi:hypothetical protein
MTREPGRLSISPGKVRKWGPLSLALVAAVIVLGAFVAATGDGGWEEGSDQPVDVGAVVEAAAKLIGFAPDPGYSIAHPTGRRVDLYRAPEGDLIDRLGPRTEFGSERTFSVVETRGDWIGVIVPELPNGKLGWLDRRSGQIELSETTSSIHVTLSRRSLELRDGADVVHRAVVTVGRAGHSTPSGRFALTDALAGRGLGPWYGCCALATSGHQTRLPPGWVGGDRIAIHGTPGPVGAAESSGCIRATNEDMVALFAVVPLGAPVFVER